MLSTYPRSKLLNLAIGLSAFTILYNIAEGIIAVYFGWTDETLALLGFGIDSFVEVLSGMGIFHMVLRMKNKPVDQHDGFEQTALYITGTAFFLLTAGLVVGAAFDIITASTPQTTLVGIIISIISILTMYLLFRTKLEVGQQLDSAPVISDAKCTKTCFYLSFILLASSLLYELLLIPYVDAAGSLGIAWYALGEGREAFEEARSGTPACADNC